jgi:DNA-directed RNA polymerase sigma subunit (sigma70/sigma32)|tara:strand:- start:2386 stop:2565 length:180 start_codon:yes stop_codon:yes gene_type:complete
MKKNEKRERLPSIKKSMRESSLQEIGDKLGLTRMRICQIEKAILEKLRREPSLEKLNET